MLASCLLALSMCPVSADAPPLAQVIQKGFPVWDIDHDGLLTLDEINLALANPEVRGEEAAAVAAIYRAARSKSHPMQPPFSLDVLVKQDPGESSTPAGDEDLGSPRLGSYYTAYVVKMKRNHAISSSAERPAWRASGKARSARAFVSLPWRH